ncbi:DUF397 domain-containing protein [Actinomadura sp. 9N407]|uniref:DUF397 domain-containing protein n=1 Tax=Actinomadura sp. 9N407 TaxID=3375154 RepID=UPI0037A64075
MHTLERPQLSWRKSRRSGGGDCVQVARHGRMVLIRDSKDCDDRTLALSRAQWIALVRALS